MLAIGQTLVILTAGIDLSVGTVMALGQVVMTKLAIDNGMSPAARDRASGSWPASPSGSLNGGLVTLVRLPAFIVTLGTLNIAFALTHIVSDDLTFSGLPSAAALLRADVHDRARRTSPTASSSCSCCTRSPGSRSRRPPGGRHVYAVGDNPEAARLTGINTNRVLLSVYALAGLMSGIAALLLVARTELGDPNAGQTTENLDSITAVVLGGTSLFGGRGSIIGTLIGAVIVGVFRNGLTLIGVEVIYQYLVTGILVILAVSVDQLTHRRHA